MSYSYQGFVIALDAVRAIYASRDEAVLARLAAPSQRYARSLLTRDHKRMSALQEILRGASCTRYEPHHYGYAVEAFCVEYGEALGELYDSDERCASALLKKRKKKVAGSRELLLGVVSSRWPIPIPETTEFPFIGCLTGAECSAWEGELGALLDALPAAESEDETRGAEFLAKLRGMCARAVARGQDLVIFYH